MMRSLVRCLAFKSHRRRAVLLLIGGVSVLLMLYGARPEVADGYRKGNPVVQLRNAGNLDDVRKTWANELPPRKQVLPGDAEHEKRHAVLLEGCREKQSSDWLEAWPRLKAVPKMANSPVISTKAKVTFCLVGKVASSFFTRWILTMKDPGPMKSPFLIPIENAGRGRAESLKNLKAGSPQKDFLESSVKIVFGRDPFSRIFSAYIDKLYSPNPFYWKYWGESALRAGRIPVKQCGGAHVTFTQFVKVVVDQLVRKDVHLKQVADECNMCQMYYDVVGKLETTVADLDYASRLANLSSEFQHEAGYKAASQQDVVLDSLKSAFSWKRDVLKCISADEMGLRIWLKLQIRGVIDSAIRYPFQPGQTDSVSAQAFIKACQEAISASTDTDKLKRQKKQALAEAYRDLSPGLISSITKAYSLDFALFGYPERPDYLVDGHGGLQGGGRRFNGTNFLKWDAPWNIR